MERGFTSLSVCFGCTGGQHRSVYSAQHLAEHLNKKFGVQVNLMHREQNIEQTFNANAKSNETMKAMIFAAGLGTRLRPLTDHTPKALVPIAGKTMLERVILRLKDAGFNDITINIHHFGEQIIEFLRTHNDFGATIHISDERDRLLDTGGGIKKARPFWTATNPFLCTMPILSAT